MRCEPEGSEHAQGISSAVTDSRKSVRSLPIFDTPPPYATRMGASKRGQRAGLFAPSRARILTARTVPSYYVGTAGGLAHGTGKCAGLFAPTLTGVIIQRTDTYSAAFVVTGVLGVAGALAAWLFVRYKADAYGNLCSAAKRRSHLASSSQILEARA